MKPDARPSYAPSTYAAGESPRLALQRGDTLAQVLVALVLLGMAAFASVALQATVARSHDAAGRLERAVRIGQSAAEALRAGLAAEHAARLLRDSLTALPDGGLAITGVAPGVAQVSVYWTEPRSGDDPTGDESCPRSADVSPTRAPRCFVLQVAA
jgi:Tfp pilus assembly protein PilV